MVKMKNKSKRETNRRKIHFREEAIEHLVKLPEEQINYDEAIIVAKLDCFACTYHDVPNPKSVNCRDNPYCIKRLGLEKFEKLIKIELANNDKAKEDQKRRDLTAQPCGLVNTGNFCYVNSFLQVWFNEPNFKQIIFDWRPSDAYVKPEFPKMDVQLLMNGLQNLFYTLETTPFFDTNKNSLIINALRLTNEQQDAQEFTLMLFDSLDRNLSTHPTGDHIRQRLKSLYTGQIRQTVSCECGMTSPSDSIFTSLSLVVEGHTTLNEALDAFFCTETLTDYRCIKCNRTGKVEKSAKVSQLPHVLLLQLNRYNIDANGRNHKIKTPLSYPRELTFEANHLVSGSSLGDKVYELFAVMIHEGDHTDSGHYYDLVRNPYTGKWFNYNDEKVEEMSKPPGMEAKDSKKPIKKSNATVDAKACYGLVYREKSDTGPQPPVLPPQQITDKWAQATESDFLGQTNDNLAQSQKRLNEVTQRYTKLNSLFTNLETDTNSNSLKEVAFLPTSLLTEILAKEYDRASTMPDDDVAQQVDGCESSKAAVGNPTEIVDDVPTKKRRGRPATVRIAQQQVATQLQEHSFKICSHGKILIDEILFGHVKAVSRQHAEILLNKYAISVVQRNLEDAEKKRALFTGNDLCLDCLKLLQREGLFNESLENTVKLANKIAKEQKTRCSTFVGKTVPADYLYVSKKALQNFKKQAESEMQHQSRVHAAGGSLRFMPGAVEKSENGNGAVLVKTVLSKRGRKRGSRGRGTHNAPVARPPAHSRPTRYATRQQAAEVEQTVSEIVNGLIEACALQEKEETEKEGTPPVDEEMNSSSAEEEEDSCDTITAESKQELMDVDMSEVAADKAMKSAAVADVKNENGSALSSTKIRQQSSEEIEDFEEEEEQSNEKTKQKEEREKKQMNGRAVEGEGAEEENRDNERSDSPSSSQDNAEQVEFNSELRCPHGSINVDQFRYAVSPTEWAELSRYFEQSFLVRVTDSCCPSCTEEDQIAYHNKNNLLETLLQLQKKYGELIRILEKRQYTESEYTHGICSLFVYKLKNAFRSRSSTTTIPPICQHCLLCKHNQPFLPLQGTNTDSQGISSGGCAQVVPLTEEEWQNFVTDWEAFSDSAPVFIPILIAKGGTIADSCTECFNTYLESVNTQRYIYQNQKIYVKIQNLTDEGALEPAKPKTTRRARKQGLFDIKLSSSDTIKTVKMALYNETGITPNDQILHVRPGGKLLEASMNELSLFEVKILPENSEEPLVLIVQHSYSPSKYEEQRERAPERGFIDTALAH